MSKYFKVILITGARQVGKTTLLKNLFSDYPVVTFDQYSDPHNARTQSDRFLEHLPAPAILDEIQFAPELLASIKRRVDTSDKMGQYFLTGSQNLSMLKTAAESMAGRVGIIDLHHMSLYELHGKTSANTWLHTYLAHPDTMTEQFDAVLDTWGHAEAIWRGNMPRALLTQDRDDLSFLFSSYQRTYIERDVRVAANISDLEAFTRFTSLCASMSGQEINYSHIGREIGVAGKTAKEWLTVLQQTYQWHSLPPYFRNTAKRLSKKQKGYFADTGLACHLLGVASPLSLATNHHTGALFETWIINSIIQQADIIASRIVLHHWRSNSGAEVDIVMSYDGMLYPIEVKMNDHVTTNATRGIRAFKAAHPHEKIAHGLVLYTGTRAYRIDEHATALPWNAVMRPSGNKKSTSDTAL